MENSVQKAQGGNGQVEMRRKKMFSCAEVLPQNDTLSFTRELKLKGADRGKQSKDQHTEGSSTS